MRQPIVDVPRFSLTGLREEHQHILLWQARGQTRLVIEGMPLGLTEGLALWIPARTRHRLTTAPNSAVMPMFFDARRHPGAAETATVVAVDAATETLFLALIGSQYSLVQPSNDLEERALAVVEAHLATPGTTPMPRSAAALRMARSVVLDPADQRTLSEWSAELHVSTRTLERAFRAETGDSWHRWRHRHRMLRAAQLLTATPLPVTEVARRVGFTTPSAFARAFREHHGTTPSACRDGAPAPVTQAGGRR